jgi:ribosomal protein L37E
MEAQPSPAQIGLGLEQHQGTNVEQQQLAGKGTSGTEHGVFKADKMQESQILQGSSSATGAGDVRVESSVIGTTGAGAVGVIQKKVTTKMCRRCGVKGHLMFECTVTVFCEICRSTDHDMSWCLILKQPKVVAQLVGQATDALAGFHIPHAPIQPTKRDLEWL